MGFPEFIFKQESNLILFFEKLKIHGSERDFNFFKTSLIFISKCF